MTQLSTEGFQFFGYIRSGLRPLFQELAFSENGRRTAEIASIQKIGKQAVENPKDLLEHGQVGVQLEEIKQDVQRTGANIALVLLFQLASEITDLGIVQEVQGRFTIIQLDHGPVLL